MFKFLTYLKHLFAATNQHGVHSPFVYNYVTKCLYSKTKYSGSKSYQVLKKSSNYFSVQNCKIITGDSKTENLLLTELDVTTEETRPFDLIYIDIPSSEAIEHYVKPTLDYHTGRSPSIHNDTIVLINNIHQNKKNHSLWEAIKCDTTITVSIDLFYCGVLFYRKEQAKEHFKIRI